MSKRVGLVLGAGGVLGGAWLTGGLKALADATGWDPGEADHIVGTSAGSVIGSLTAAGIPAWFMVDHSHGETFDGLTGPDGRPAGEADRSGGGVFKLRRGLPGIGPGSWRLGLATLAQPMRHTPAALAAGWLPRGVISTHTIEDTIRRAVPGDWAEHPNLWVVACDYASARRTVFGREGSPPAELPQAVAASCSIPGFFHPVTISGRRYVDGGMRSPSNLDLLAGLDLDVVICLNPTSTLERGGGWNPLDRVAGAVRTGAGRRLGYEARRVREGGTDVVLIQPTAEDLLVMGRNLMAGKKRNEVIDKAIETVGEQLRAPEVARKLSALPAGEPHKLRRPQGPVESWPEIGPAMRRAERAARVA